MRRFQDQIVSESDRAIALLQDLVRIPSITGEEIQVQSFLSKELARLNLEVKECASTLDQLSKHPAFSNDGLPLEGRSSLVGRWRGTDKDGRSLILNGHVDVVPPGDLKAWADSPWSGHIRDGQLYGRGACDMKGGLATILLALSALQKAGIQPRGDVIVEFVIGEETGGVGTLSTILQGYTADAAIVAEPTQLQMCPVGAGAASFRLHVSGLAAHGSMRLEGVNAIEKFSVIHRALSEFETERHRSFEHPLYNNGLAAPISVGKIQAGDWPSSVPDLLIAEGRYGVLPGEKISEAREKFEKKIQQIAAQDAWLSTHPPVVEWFEGQFEPAETALDSDLIRALSETHQKITGGVLPMHGVPYGSDLRFFTNHAKIPAVLYGPGNVMQAHAANEYIRLDEMMIAAEVLAQFIVQWCRI
jgi:acetylornithine deacetylase